MSLELQEQGLGLERVVVELADQEGLLRKRPKYLLWLVNSTEAQKIKSALINWGDNASIRQVDAVGIKSLTHMVDEIVVTRDIPTNPELTQTLCAAHLRGVKIRSFEMALLELDPRIKSTPSEVIYALTQTNVERGSVVQFYNALKNWIEPVLAVFALILLSPILIIVALAIKFTSAGPVIYSQTRNGLGEVPFEIYKFRSMRMDAEAEGAVWASARIGDNRLTSIGGFLRSTHLDELPQLWNVVKGHLSFIGPRPERPVFCKKIEGSVPLFGMRTMIKPGITGWAQINQGYANSIDDSRRKLEYDLYYLLKNSLKLDFKIALGTFKTLISGGTEARKRKMIQNIEPMPEFAPVPLPVSRTPRSRLPSDQRLSS